MINCFLQSREAVDAATKFLEENNLVTSGLSCKNWEIASVIPYLKDGDLIDLGSSGSVVLENAVALKLEGRKVGVDLVYEKNSFLENGIELYKDNLMYTGFPNDSFDIITCLSVLEHEVNFERFFYETYRLLKTGGNLFVSFDFWEPKPAYEKRKLYNLDWNILDKKDVLTLVGGFKNYNMELTSEIDWTLQDAVINSAYCSPVEGVEYTFGILNFVKQ